MPKTRKKVMVETHGKLEDDAPRFQPTLLEHIWGDDGMSRYGTSDEAEYTRRLDQMTRADLEVHARQMGVIITENSTRLREKLLSAFRSYSSLIRKPAPTPQTPAKVSEEALSVLREGR